MGKYDPLAQYLRAQSAPYVVLSFAEIESLIGAQLPRSARERREWWWNDLARQSSHVQSRSWVHSGYLASVTSFEEQRIIFHRRVV